MAALLKVACGDGLEWLMGVGVSIGLLRPRRVYRFWWLLRVSQRKTSMPPASASFVPQHAVQQTVGYGTPGHSP